MIEDVTELQSADDVLRILNDSPSQPQVKQCLDFFRQDLAFDVHAPGALQTQLFTVLVTKTLPDFYDACEEDAAFRNALLWPLISIPGLGAIVTTLTTLHHGRSKSDARFDTHSTSVLLGSLDVILRDNKHVVQIWSELSSSPSLTQTQKDLLWKEYVSLTAGGKITSTVARYGREELGSAGWLAEGSTFACWLGRTVGQLTLTVFQREMEANGDALSATQLCSRSLSFGYPENFLSSLIDALCLHTPPKTVLFSTLFKSLKPYEQRKFIDWLLEVSAKQNLTHHPSAQDTKTPQTPSKALRAFIALLQSLVHEDDLTLDQLCDWLTNPQRSANAPTLTVRAVIAVVADNEDKLEMALSKIWELWANQLFIRHAPTAQQDALTRILLMAAGYVHRMAPMYLFTMARSSVNTHGLSNRLASSSPRARWLGMVVGMGISAITDKKDTRLVFDAKDMKTDEAKWYCSLTQIEDKAGDIQDLHIMAGEKLIAVPAKRQTKANNLRTESTSKNGRATKSLTSDELIEPTESRIPTSLRIIDLDDAEDFIPHAKPDSDPEDDTMDATMVNRNKPKPPIYIRDLIKYLLDSENIEQRTLALQTTPSLIRRKAGHGKEVTDHLEELATVIAGLNDGDTFDLDDEEFARLRQRSLQAVLVTDAKKMGPWFAKAIFNVTADYSVVQRMGLLVAIGLGGRELAGYKDGNDNGDDEADTFPSKRLKGKMRDIWSTGPEQGKGPKKLKPIGRAGLITNTPNVSIPSAVDRLTTDLERTMLEPLALDAADKLSGPDVLKVRKFSSRMDVERNKAKPKANELSKIVAEAFFFPLTGYLSTGVQTRSTGSSASFNKYLLATYLRTLSLLLHSAGPSSPAFSTLVAEFWELLLTMRSAAAHDPPALEALLFSLLTILEISGDRHEEVIRDHAKELIETQEWTRMILDKAQSGGGEEEERVKMLAAGVVVPCSEIVQKYQRRLLGDMVDM